MKTADLKKIYLDQREYFWRDSALINRDIELAPYLSSRKIIAITGVRRCGKSSLLKLIFQSLKIPQEECLYFNFDDERLASFETKDFNALLELHLALSTSPAKPVLIFDEIQNTTGWEKFLNRMYENGFKVFITGSNATLLSSEIATALTGRNLTLPLFPFSFREHLRFRKKTFDTEKLSSSKEAELNQDFNHYMQFGGFPLVLAEENLEILRAYYQDILYRDIIARYKITSIDSIKQLALYLASNVGKPSSYKTLQQVAGISSLSGVKRYLSYLENAFLFSTVRKFDYSLKKQLLNPRKIYACDIAFCRALGFRFSEDSGRLLENMVFNELQRRGCEIFYHANKKECDFVVREGIEISQAIQVTYDMSDPNTAKREIEGLREALDAYGLSRGLIITRNESGKHKLDGHTIELKPITHWLLEQQTLAQNAPVS